MADDLGYGEVGVYGQTKIPTPNIDRLAREGVRFTRAYSASPVCAPTRYSLLTGKHQGHAAIRGNKEQGGFGPNDPEGQFPMPKSETTIAEILRKKGYRTGIVGKWGLGGPTPGEHPMDHGFDHFYGYLCQRRAHNHYTPYLWRDRGIDLLGNPMFDSHQRIEAPLATEDEYFARFAGPTYAPEKMAQAACDFVEAKSAKPFFLYYAPTLPHVALQAPREWIEKFPREWDAEPYLGQGGYLPNPRPRATYAAMIAFLDDTVGRLLASLEKAGAADNTLVIFTSDNGPTNAGGVDEKFFGSSGGLRAGKMSLYEGGIRVPFVARWPGKSPRGASSDRLVASYDTLATLAEVAGALAPKSDGASYRSSLEGLESARPGYLYFEYPEASSMQAVVFGRYKAIRPNLRQTPELLEVYDLERDPSESQDLAKERPDLVRRAWQVFGKEHRRNADFPLPGVDRISK